MNIIFITKSYVNGKNRTTVKRFAREEHTGKDQIEAGKVKDVETSGDLLLTSHIFY